MSDPLLIFNLGPMEMFVILVVALLIFGSRLPDVARSMGKSLTQFKRGLRDIESDVDESVKGLKTPEAPGVSTSEPNRADALPPPVSTEGGSATKEPS